MYIALSWGTLCMYTHVHTYIVRALTCLQKAWQSSQSLMCRIKFISPEFTVYLLHVLCRLLYSKNFCDNKRNMKLENGFGFLIFVKKSRSGTHCSPFLCQLGCSQATNRLHVFVTHITFSLLHLGCILYISALKSAESTIASQRPITNNIMSCCECVCTVSVFHAQCKGLV